MNNEKESGIRVSVIAPRGQPVYRLRLQGTDREIGRQRGRVLGPDLRAMWEWMQSRMSTLYGLPEQHWDAVATQCEANCARQAPWLVEQIHGMAETGGLCVRDLMLANCYGLIWNNAGNWCSSVAVHTDDAGPLLGQNLDIAWDDFYYAEEIHAAGAQATLGDAMLCLCTSPCGINAAGLAIGTSNLSAPGRRAQPWEWTGVNYHHIARMILRQCATTEEAVEQLRALSPVVPSGGGYQFNLIDAAGKMAVVDKCGSVTCVRQCASGLNFTTNCTPDPEFERWRLGRDGGNPNGQARAARVRRAWDELGGARPTRAWMVALMRDRSAEGALCRVNEHSYSRLGFIYESDSRSVDISNGPPDRNAYTHLTFTHKAE